MVVFKNVQIILNYVAYMSSVMPLNGHMFIE